MENLNSGEIKVDEGRFSFFRKPVSNTKMYKAIGLEEVYKYLTSDYAKGATERLREMIAEGKERRELQRYKGTALDYVTFSGVFEGRGAAGLVSHSGLICLDLDHLGDVEGMFKRITEDEDVGARLVFRSPSGDGLKVVVEADPRQGSQEEWFAGWQGVFEERFDVEVDGSGKDVCRACYLCYDPSAYIKE